MRGVLGSDVVVGGGVCVWSAGVERERICLREFLEGGTLELESRRVCRSVGTRGF